MNTKKHIYVRPAGIDQMVVRHSFQGHYITKEAGEILGAFQNQLDAARSPDD